MSISCAVSACSAVLTSRSDKLHGIDDNVLNPAISAVVGTILGAVGKTEEIIKPLITSILKPIGLIKDDTKTSATPEITSKPVTVA